MFLILLSSHLLLLFTLFIRPSPSLPGYPRSLNFPLHSFLALKMKGSRESEEREVGTHRGGRDRSTFPGSCTRGGGAWRPAQWEEGKIVGKRNSDIKPMYFITKTCGRMEYRYLGVGGRG